MRRSVARGFTLIELVVTMAIIGILVTGLFPLTQMASQRSKEQELRMALRDIRAAIDAYKKAADEGRIEKKADTSGYPPTLKVLEEGVKDAKSPEDKKIYFIRRIPRDPFFEKSDSEPIKTWGLRSYESAPDEPKEGDDVFDVFSTSQRVGLNGVPYKQW